MTPGQRPAAAVWARVRWATAHPDIWGAAGTPHHVSAIAPVDLIERARASVAEVAA